MASYRKFRLLTAIAVASLLAIVFIFQTNVHSSVLLSLPKVQLSPTSASPSSSPTSASPSSSPTSASPSSSPTSASPSSSPTSAPPSSSPTSAPTSSRPKPLSEYTHNLVIGRLKKEDVTWLDRELPEINRTIYIVDEPMSTPSIPKNKGHESMVYLTYIIDHYERLPEIVLFFHPHKLGWHNNVLLSHDAAKTILRLSGSRIIRDGYFNTRCHLKPGCPDWIHIDRPKTELSPNKLEEGFFTSELWQQLHPEVPIPVSLSQPCCAQFAVSGERIRSRPRSDYIRYRDWLLNTEFDDRTSGRIMEYMWQFIFTGRGEYCPSQNECYCDGYGICFGGDKQLLDWLNLESQKMLFDAQLLDWKQQEGDYSEEIMALNQNKTRFLAHLDSLKDEAIRKGEDPRNRAIAAGREWREGDGF